MTPDTPLSVTCRPLLRVPRAVDPSMLLLGWRSVWGPDPGLTEVRATEKGLTCTVDGMPCGLGTMSAPLPRHEVLGAADSSWLWPDVGVDATSCTGHAVVWAAHPGGGQEAVRAHVALSRLVAAALPVLDAPGVHVPGADMLVRADLWTGLTVQSPLPLLLWVRLDCRPESTGTTVLVTTGLPALGLPEVEVAGSTRTTEELRSWAVELLGWLLTEQPALHDGDTLAVVPGERVLVRYARSVLDRPEPVLRLVDRA